jgi:hypothetical protein
MTHKSASEFNPMFELFVRSELLESFKKPFRASRNVSFPIIKRKADPYTPYESFRSQVIDVDDQ